MGRMGKPARTRRYTVQNTNKSCVSQDGARQKQDCVDIGYRQCAADAAMTVAGAAGSGSLPRQIAIR